MVSSHYYMYQTIQILVQEYMSWYNFNRASKRITQYNTLLEDFLFQILFLDKAT